MTIKPGPSDYRASSTSPELSQDGRGGPVSRTSQDLEVFASDIIEAIKQRPYTAVAVAGGLAFVIGALWIVSRQKPRTIYDDILARLPQIPDRQSVWPLRGR